MTEIRARQALVLLHRSVCGLSFLRHAHGGCKHRTTSDFEGGHLIQWCCVLEGHWDRFERSCICIENRPQTTAGEFLASSSPASNPPPHSDRGTGLGGGCTSGLRTVRSSSRCNASLAARRTERAVGSPLSAAATSGGNAQGSPCTPGTGTHSDGASRALSGASLGGLSTLASSRRG